MPDPAPLYLPLQLDPDDRALLGAIYGYGPVGRLLHPCQNRSGYKLEHQDLVHLEFERYALASYGLYVSRAFITPLGARVIEGPLLVCVDGAPVEPPGAAYFTHDSLVDAIVAASTPKDGNGDTLPGWPGGI